MVNCNECKNVSMTEDGQRKAGTKEPHMCMKYNQRVLHRSQSKGYHGVIWPCAECERDEFAQFMERSGGQ